jgi:hypothetical protein
MMVYLNSSVLMGLLAWRVGCGAGVQHGYVGLSSHAWFVCGCSGQEHRLL